MSCSSSSSGARSGSKTVWVWTGSRQVMTAGVERGWSTFLFRGDPEFRELAKDWSSTALIRPLFVEDARILDEQGRKAAALHDVSSPQDLARLQPQDLDMNSVVIDFKSGWQVIPAENVVAKFQGFAGNVMVVSNSAMEAQVFLEALEQGVDGVVLKVDDMQDIIKLKDYFDRRNASGDRLPLTKATVSKVDVVGTGDRVCVDLCSLMRPGEGMLVGSFARGLFLVQSECLDTSYIASRPFRVNAGPVHSYAAVPEGKTCYLSELRAGSEVIVADRTGLWRTATVGRIKIERRPLILVEAKDSNGQDEYTIFLQNAETVALVGAGDHDWNSGASSIPVTHLKPGDEVLLLKQGGARHTGLEIREFVVEK